MYDRALIDRTLLAIAVASNAPISPATSPILHWLLARLQPRSPPAGSAGRLGDAAAEQAHG
jgi:hypothetical protein